MTACQGNVKTPPLYLKVVGEKNLKTLLRTNFETFLEYLYKQGMVVDVKERFQDNFIRSDIVLLFPPTCFKVDFNDTFATIAPIKK